MWEGLSPVWMLTFCPVFLLSSEHSVYWVNAKQLHLMCINLLVPSYALWCHRTVNIGSGNGLVPSGNKPLPEPVFSYHQVKSWCIHPWAISLEMFKISNIRISCQITHIKIKSLPSLSEDNELTLGLCRCCINLWIPSVSILTRQCC